MKYQEKEAELTTLLNKCYDKKYFIQIAVGDRWAIAINTFIDKNDFQQMRIIGGFKDFEEIKDFLLDKISKSINPKG